MLASKIVKGLTLIMLILIICSSCDDTKTDSKYYKGSVINRAELKYPLGMIRFDGVFDVDEELESPARGIIYHVSDGGNAKFNLYDQVYFRIGSSGKYQVAKDVVIDTTYLAKHDASHLATKDEIYSKVPSISLNLHNADVHREGPKHTRKHIIQRIGSIGYNFSDGVASLIETRKEFTTESQYIFVRESDYLANPTGIFFFSESSFLVNNPVVGLSSTQDYTLYNMSTTHDHTH